MARNVSGKSPAAQVWEAMTGIVRRVAALETGVAKSAMRVGAARPLAAREKATAWREIEVGGETFRVLTIEDGE